MHNNIHLKIMYVAFALSLAQTLQAQQHDILVQKAVKALTLNLDSILKDAEPGTKQYFDKGQKITLRINKERRVEHIGIPLFNPFIRALQPSPIYDYLEYAALDHKFHISESDLQLQQLKFLKGEWKSLENLSDTMMCNVTNVEDKYYVVKWYENEEEVVAVSFPINYELLANSNRKEILDKFVASLKQFQTDEKITLNIDTFNLSPYNKSGIYVKEGDSYSVPSINTNTYFMLKEGKKKRYEWLFDKEYPGETLANRILSPGSFAGKPIMNIVCYLYNHRKETFTTSLVNWMAFCKQGGCKPYFGFESNLNGLLTSTLIMRNRESGYDHILTIKCQQDQLESDDLQLNVTAYLYAPSANVSDLFHKSDRTSQKRQFITQ